MDILNKPGRRLRYIAGSLGIIQATTWICLALACLIVHFRYDSLEEKDIIGGLLYAYLLDEETSGLFSGELNPPLFIFFAIVYIVVDTVWLIVSIYVLVKKNKFGFITWGVITIMICLIDFIIVILLGNDYDRCKKLNYMNVTTCATAILPALVIVAKGFVLWIINLIFAIILFRMSRKLKHPAVSGFLIQPYPPGYNIPNANTQAIPDVSNPQNYNLNYRQHGSENHSAPNFQNWNPNQFSNASPRPNLLQQNNQNLNPNQLQATSNEYLRPNSVPSQSWRHVQPNNQSLITSSLQEVFQHRQNRAREERDQRVQRQNSMQHSNRY